MPEQVRKWNADYLQAWNKGFSKIVLWKIYTGNISAAQNWARILECLLIYDCILLIFETWVVSIMVAKFQYA
jgi:hypothetical protein